MTRPYGPREAYAGRGRPRRKPSGLTRPPDADTPPGVTWVQFHGSPRRDRFGRREFSMYWHDAGLPERGGSGTTRGQVFHADDREHMQRALDAGERVLLWPSRFEVTLEHLRPGLDVPWDTEPPEQ